MDGDNKVTEIDSLNMVLPRAGTDRFLFGVPGSGFVCFACVSAVRLVGGHTRAYRHIEVSDVREGDHISLFNYYVDESGKVRRVQLI